MNIELVVVQPFAGRAKGEVVSDPAEMAAILAANPHCVVQRAVAQAAPPDRGPGQAAKGK